MNDSNDTIPHRDAPPPWFVMGCFLSFVMIVAGIVFIFVMGISKIIDLIFGG